MQGGRQEREPDHGGLDLRRKTIAPLSPALKNKLVNFFISAPYVFHADVLLYSLLLYSLQPTMLASTVPVIPYLVRVVDVHGVVDRRLTV
jgi:hypothetical protein